MIEPTKEQQSEYYRLYAEIEASFKQQTFVKYTPKSALIHAEVARRMGLNEEDKCKVCQGNNTDMPCAYPGEKLKGCLQNG